MTPWSHNSLAADLAAHLMRDGANWCWLNIKLGSHGARPDVYAMAKWQYHHPVFTTFECKISRADLLSDLGSGKWQKYREFSSAVTFALPHGLAKKAEIPDECGLILRSDRCWAHARKPKIQPVDIPTAIVVKLLSSRPVRSADLRSVTPSAVHSEWNEKKRLLQEWENRAKSRALGAIGKRYGVHIANMLRNPDYAQEVIRRAKSEADRIVANARREHAEARTEWTKLAMFCGLDGDAEDWKVRSELTRLVRQLTGDGLASERGKKLEQIRKLLDEDAVIERLAS